MVGKAPKSGGQMVGKWWANEKNRAITETLGSA